MMVPSLDIAFVRDAYQVRRMIEATALPAVLDRLDPARLAAILATHEALQAELGAVPTSAAPALLDRIQRVDWEMHETFVHCLGNALMDNIYRVTAIKIRMVVQGRLRVTRGNAARVLSEHLGILRAIKARDRAGAAAALMRHIDKSLAIALGAETED
jgi:DNA-binding GntR family transcriptional regulator